MSVEAWLYIGLSICGIILAYLSYNAKKLSWFRFLFFIICLQATRDLGISPLYAELMVENYASEIFERVHGIEAYNALALIGLCYASLAFGIWLVYHFIGARLVKGMKQNKALSPSYYYNDSGCRRCYSFAAVVAVMGLWANVMVILFLMSDFNILDIALARATYSSELNLTDFRYAYLRMLSDLLLIGSFAMVYFSKGRGTRYKVAIFFALLQILFEVLYGGRARMLLSLILFALVNHLVHPIRLKRVLLYALCAFILVVVIGNLRLDFTGIDNLIHYSFKSFAMQDYARVDDTAYILNLFPETIPYTGWLNFLGSAVRLIPTVYVPGTNSLYGYMVEELYGGINSQAGIGGMNYSTAAELYSWGGFTSVIVFGIVYGSLYAYLLAWAMRNRFSPVVVLFALIVFVKSFLLGVSSRLPDTLGGVFTVFISLAIIASAISLKRDRLYLYIILMFDGVMFIILNLSRASGSTIIPKTCIVLSIPLLYYICIKIMTHTSDSYRSDINRNMTETRSISLGSVK
jgi:hypothetical protein